MNVLLDVNILGRGFAAEATRTGIFRATEGLVQALLLRSDLSLSFAAEASWVSELQLLAYDRERAGRLTGRIRRAWHQPDVADSEGAALIARILAEESQGRDARKIRASLMLLNAGARRSTLPGAYDVVHSMRTPLPAGSRISARMRALTVHDVIPLLHPEWMYQGAEPEVRAIMSSIDVERDCVVANSETTAADVAALLGMSRERIFVTPLAAAADVFHAGEPAGRIDQVRARYGIPGGMYVLSLCTLEPRKNLPHLIRAFFRLVDQERLPELHLVLVGPTGWKAEDLFATLEQRPDLGSRIRLTGFVPDEDLAALYAGARVFAYPSLYEGFGLPVLEAMQCGTPVVTSNTSSLPEVAGDAAVSVSPGDGDALCEALRRVITDDAWAAELRRRGLARAGLFSWDRTADLTVRAYRRMLAMR